METNEAPEKIYLHPDLDSILGMAERSCESEIEYTRTDAFIEKAKEWLRYNNDLIDGDVDDYVEDFVNYMKGE